MLAAQAGHIHRDVQDTRFFVAHVAARARPAGSEAGSRACDALAIGGLTELTAACYPTHDTSHGCHRRKVEFQPGRCRLAFDRVLF
jgi:hypothetical protein